MPKHKSRNARGACCREERRAHTELYYFLINLRRFFKIVNNFYVNSEYIWINFHSVEHYLRLRSTLYTYGRSKEGQSKNGNTAVFNGTYGLFKDDETASISFMFTENQQRKWGIFTIEYLQKALFTEILSYFQTLS